MTRLQILFALLVGLFFQTSVSAQDDRDKIGTVSMQKLLAEYHKTKQVEELFKGYSEEVVGQNDERVKTIKEMVERFRDLQKEAENPNITNEKRGDILMKAESLQREVNALQNDRMEWLQRKNAAFAEKKKIELGKLRIEIMEMVKEVGKESGYDFIFDRSGASGSNILILAYAKDATDLTGVMIKRINRDAPEEVEKADKAEPAEPDDNKETPAEE